MLEYNYLKFFTVNQVTTLTISAPRTLNALDSIILRELDSYLDNLNFDETRVLVITGDGEKSFIAGANISEMQNLNEEEGFNFGKLGAAVFRKIETLPIPVIAAVNGFALGGGCELALACDIRIASVRAKFGQPEVGLGIIPGFSGTVRLAKAVGLSLAKEMIFTGKVINAEEALRVGLVSQVCEQDALLLKAYEIADKIVLNAPIAVKYAKECINNCYDMDAENAILFENKLFGKCFATEDQKEGMTAFLAKRKPEFKNK